MNEKARPLRPWRAIAENWRGGRIVAVRESEIDVLLRAEQSYEHVYTIARSLFPSAYVNAAIVARLAPVTLATAIADYVILELRGTKFCGLEEGTIGAVSYELTNESAYWED